MYETSPQCGFILTGETVRMHRSALQSLAAAADQTVFLQQVFSTKVNQCINFRWAVATHVWSLLNRPDFDPSLATLSCKIFHVFAAYFTCLSYQKHITETITGKLGKQFNIGIWILALQRSEQKPQTSRTSKKSRLSPRPVWLENLVPPRNPMAWVWKPQIWKMYSVSSR